MSDDFAQTYGFSPAKRAGALVFLSGSIGMNERGEISVDPAEQYAAAFGALGSVLEKEGLGPDDLVEMVSYHTNYPDHMEEFMAAKARFLKGALPAWTAIGAAALGTPETLVEIRAVALAKS